jgi:DNA-binding response OmpR family regulator
VEREFAILVAERNPRVRQFLKREFVADGFVVLLAENGSDLARIIRIEDGLDLLILDNELPGFDEPGMVAQLANRVPPLPFVIHSLSIEGVSPGLAEAAGHLVEKTGNIEELRKAVQQVLLRTYPDRFVSSGPSVLDGKPGKRGAPMKVMEVRKA